MQDLLTVAEVAHVLRVDATTVRRWIQQGTLAAVTLPHANKRQAYRVTQEALRTVLNTSANGPQTKKAAL